MMDTFWRLLFGDGTGFLCIATIKRNGDQRGRLLQRYFRYPEQIEKAAQLAREADGEGLEVYFCAHLLTEPIRKKPYAAPLLALYADGDDAQVPEGVLEPSVVVQSSPGRTQLYWRLSHAVEPKLGEDLNERLTYAMGADKSGWDLTQLLRPPGTHNNKYPDAPEVSVSNIDGPVYDPEWLNEVLPPLPEKPKPAANTPPPAAPIIEDDEELLEKARKANNGGEFVRLYDEGDISEYIENGKPNHSSADWALLSHLCFWTGADAERMARLFKQSAIHRPNDPKKDAGYVERNVKYKLEKYTGSYYDPESRAKEARAAIEEHLVPLVRTEAWKGLTGATDRAVFQALLMAGCEKGRLQPKGVRVTISYRELQERAGIGSRRTIAKSLKRLEERELIHQIKPEKGRKSGGVFLKSEPLVITGGETICNGDSVEDGAEDTNGSSNGSPLSKSLHEQTLRLRYGMSKYSHTRRLGKSAAAVVDEFLDAPDKTLSVQALARQLDKRTDNVRRTLRRLASALREQTELIEEKGLIEEIAPDLYRLAPDFEERFSAVLDSDGSSTAERLQKATHEREREAWRTLKDSPPDLAPDEEELKEHREAAERRERDWVISLLGDGPYYLQDVCELVDGGYQHARSLLLRMEDEGEIVIRHCSHETAFSLPDDPDVCPDCFPETTAVSVLNRSSPMLSKEEVDICSDTTRDDDDGEDLDEYEREAS